MSAIAQLWARMRQRRRRKGFQSAFGGLWTDRMDGDAAVARKLLEGSIDEEEARSLTHWIEEGYWILPGAVRAELVDRLVAETDALWSSSGADIVVETGGQLARYSQELRREHCKLVDLYMRSTAALEVATSEPILTFLRLVFGADPVLFQSLSFERGSEQPAHRDLAYVVVTPPLHMAAAWIALEEVRPGSGELFYYPRSHRLEDYTFRGGFLHWNRERDGETSRRRHEEWLLERMDELGLGRVTFRPRKGDVLVWSAGLVHGGTPIEDPRSSRKSLACHYCPSGAKPYYANFKGRSVSAHRSGASWISSHYPS